MHQQSNERYYYYLLYNRLSVMFMQKRAPVLSRMFKYECISDSMKRAHFSTPANCRLSRYLRIHVFTRNFIYKAQVEIRIIF